MAVRDIVNEPYCLLKTTVKNFRSIAPERIAAARARHIAGALLRAASVLPDAPDLHNLCDGSPSARHAVGVSA